MNAKRLEFLFLAVMLNQTTLSQEKVWERPPRVLWVTFGAGILGTTSFWGGSAYLGMSHDSEIGLLSLRTSIGFTAHVRPSDEDIFEIPITSVTDLGVMYGVCDRGTTSILSASAGIAVVWTKEKSTTEDVGVVTIGIPFELQAAVIPLPVLAIGLKAYGNFNVNNPFVGILVCFHFSKFRQLQSDSQEQL